MTIEQFVSFLGWYKGAAQIDDLPDTAYIDAAFNELKSHDARYVFYAIKDVWRTEPTFNKYPQVAQILNHMPSFYWERRDIEEAAKKIKSCLERHYKPNHWAYDSNKREIAYWSKMLGSDTPLTDVASVDNAAAKLFALYENKFFTGELPQIENATQQQGRIGNE